jgi:hypothetical protein
MSIIFYLLINVVIIALFLYSKLTPYKTNLTGRYQTSFLFFERLFQPVLDLLRKIAKPVIVGNGIAVDMSQIILLVLFLIILKLI